MDFMGQVNTSVCKFRPDGTSLSVAFFAVALSLSFLGYPVTSQNFDDRYATWHRLSDGPFFIIIIPLVDLVVDSCRYIDHTRRKARVQPSTSCETSKRVEGFDGEDAKGNSSTESADGGVFLEDSADPQVFTGELSFPERLFFIVGMIFMSVPSFMLQWADESDANMPSASTVYVFCGVSAVCCLSAIGSYLQRWVEDAWMKISLGMFVVLFCTSTVLSVYADTSANSNSTTALIFTSSSVLLVAAALFTGFIFKTTILGRIQSCVMDSQHARVEQSEAAAVAAQSDDGSEHSKRPRPIYSITLNLTLPCIALAALVILIPIVVDCACRLSAGGDLIPANYSLRSYTSVAAGVLVFLVDAHFRKSNIVNGLVRHANQRIIP
jgi:hypothetical protein